MYLLDIKSSPSLSGRGRIWYGQNNLSTNSNGNLKTPRGILIFRVLVLVCLPPASCLLPPASCFFYILNPAPSIREILKGADRVSLLSEGCSSELQWVAAKTLLQAATETVWKRQLWPVQYQNRTLLPREPENVFPKKGCSYPTVENVLASLWAMS